MEEPVRARPSPFPPDRREPDDFAKALAELVDRDALRTREVQRRQMGGDREGVHPKLLEFEKRLLAKARRAGIPLVVRFHVEDLFGEEFDPSPYEVGLACRVYHAVQGFALSGRAWAILGHLGLETTKQAGLSMVWGGVKAPYHWEHKPWRELQGGFPFARPSNWKGYAEPGLTRRPKE